MNALSYLAELDVALAAKGKKKVDSSIYSTYSLIEK